MADFFNSNNQNDKGTEPEKIKVGEVEYSIDELSALVQDGQFKREVESKQNTKIDKVFGEYTKLTQAQKDWEAKEADYERKLAEATKPAVDANNAGELTPEVIAQAKAEAKKIGLLSAEDVQEYFDKKFPEMYSQQRAYDKIIDTANDYAKEIDGNDGRPAYVVEDVFGHMKETGIRDPYKAYKDLHETALDEWKAKQISSKRDGFVTETSSTAGGKQPAEVRPTRDNLDALLKESLRS